MSPQSPFPQRLAVISAVAFESQLLQDRLEPVAGSPGLPLWHGRLAERPVLLALTGVGKANAARAVTLLLERHAPQAVVMIGCAGAYPAAELAPGDLAVAECELFGDEGAMTSAGFLDLAKLGLPLHSDAAERLYNRIPCDPTLLARALPGLRAFAEARHKRLGCGAFVTVSCCSGTDRLGQELARRTGGLCENMEGAAAALCCRAWQVPFFELRGISNLVEERNPARWELAAAVEIAQQALLTQLPALATD